MADDRLPDKSVWHSHERWRAILERRLNQIGSEVAGNRKAQADRVADVVEQIESARNDLEQLRKEFEEVRDRQAKIADWLKKNATKREGDRHEARTPNQEEEGQAGRDAQTPPARREDC